MSTGLGAAASAARRHGSLLPLLLLLLLLPSSAFGLAVLWRRTARRRGEADAQLMAAELFVFMVDEVKSPLRRSST